LVPCLAQPIADFCNKICPEADIKTQCPVDHSTLVGARTEQQHYPERTGIHRRWSGTVVKSGPHERSGILPRRLVGRGGASVVRRNAAIDRMEDSYVQICKEAFA
jgi:hypothetical protein